MHLGGRRRAAGESAHLQRKTEQLLRFREEEDDRNVIQWIDKCVEILDSRIRQAKISEERDYL